MNKNRKLRHFPILEESTPEKIKGDVAANEEQECDLGWAIEDARNSNWGFVSDIVSRVKGEEEK